VGSRELDLRRVVGLAGVGRPLLDDLSEMERRQKLAELEMLRLERMLEEERRRLEQLRRAVGGDQQQQQQQQAALAPLSLVLAANPKVVETLRSMSDEDLVKLAMLLAVAQSGAQGAAVSLPLMLALLKPQQGGSTGNPSGHSQQGQQVTLEGIAALIKAVADVVSSRQQPQQPQSPTSLLKDVAEAMRIIAEASGNRELEKRIEQLERRIVTPDEWFKFIRENAELLGLRPGSVDKEIERMRLELEKWKAEKDMELRKWLVEQERDARTAEMIARLFEGPLGRVVDRVSSAAVQRLAANPTPMEEVVCPSCGGRFSVPHGASVAVCPHCGQALRRVVEGAASGGGAGAQQRQQ